ncbi:MAG: hypothetical protein KME20_05745 [Kaiparowitsia implicata GSE-PSE-MK54-09C]|jgi:hypothetical protein|nr:hypothetical protein [Kaiparowitsia implicata GSE-PSE-MK54-09C]
MPFTLNGIGTIYYGNRDRAVDGSYITTEWFVVVYVPIFPIASYRVRPAGQGTNLIFYYSNKYLVERVPLCWPQVRSVYAFTGPIFGILALLLIGPAIASNPSIGPVIGILLLCAIAFFVFIKPNKSPSKSPNKAPKTPPAPPTTVTVDCQPAQALPMGRGDGEQRGRGDGLEKARKPPSQPDLAPAHPLYSKVLYLLNSDRETADRLLTLVRRQHPDRSTQWHHEKVIDDLIRDRH